MTAADFKIFDEKTGAPIKVADEIRATLTPTQCELLDKLQQSAHAERMATAAHATATKRLHAAVRDHTQVSIDRDAAIPRLTQQDLLAQVAAAHGQR